MNDTPLAHVDMIVYDQQERPMLLVEAKVGKQPLAEIRRTVAEQVRRADLSQARFFLLAMPQQFYLWHNPYHTLLNGLPPMATAELQHLLGPFAHEHGLVSRLAAGGLVGHRSLEFLIETWVDLLLDPRSTELVQSDQQRAFLIDTGLLTAIQGGHLTTAPALS